LVRENGTAMAHTEEGEGGRGEGTRRKIHGAPELSGGLRRTREAGSLPSLRRSSEPCVVTTKERAWMVVGAKI